MKTTDFNVSILMLCMLVVKLTFKHFIFIHCSASFTWVPKGLGAAYAADRVWKRQFYLFQFLFNCVL